MLTIGLLWHSATSKNLGVGALTYSQMALVKKAAASMGESVQFRLLGWIAKDGHPLLPNVISECGIRRNIILPWNNTFIKHVRGCDIVLDIGEGDSFTDIYGLERFAFFTGTKLMVRLLGRPLILSPQTIGPFNRTLTRALAAFTMRRCQQVYARDHLSMQYLRDNNVHNVDEAIDVAFALPYKQQPRSAGEKIRVGINVSGLLYSGGYTRDNQFGLSLDYAALTHTLLDWFTARTDCEVYLVSHVVIESLPEEDDLRVCRELGKRYPTVQVVEQFADPVEAKTFIATMDFFIGARMHACIAAFSSGVPVVPLAYSRKFNGLFESLGYRHYGDCKQASIEQIVSLVQDAYANRAELKTLVDQGNVTAQEKLSRYENFLIRTLQACHDKKK